MLSDFAAALLPRPSDLNGAWRWVSNMADDHFGYAVIGGFWPAHRPAGWLYRGAPGTPVGLPARGYPARWAWRLFHWVIPSSPSATRSIPGCRAIQAGAEMARVGLLPFFDGRDFVHADIEWAGLGDVHLGEAR